jgi:multimeric flavodoxin WrbA
MKVLLINGSPHEHGSTATALGEVQKVLESSEVTTKVYNIGTKAVQGCTACHYCKKEGNTGCVFKDDMVNEIIDELANVDGIIIGSPVYYASANGSMISMLDRLFYAGGNRFSNKVGASVVVARRGGLTATFDELNKYFTIANMPVVSSQYWNQVHGHNAEEVKQDLEGMQTMRRLGQNMVWLMQSIEAGKKAGIAAPQLDEERVYTNFIR